MASGLPGGAAAKPAEYVAALGKGYGAKVPGLNDLVPLDHPSMTVHLGTDTQFDPGGDAPMVNLHGAFHAGQLPPALEKLIADAVALVQQLGMVHDYAGSPNRMPGSAPDDDAPPTGGLPGGTALAA